MSISVQNDLTVYQRTIYFVSLNTKKCADSGKTRMIHKTNRDFNSAFIKKIDFLDDAMLSYMRTLLPEAGISGSDK